MRETPDTLNEPVRDRILGQIQPILSAVNLVNVLQSYLPNVKLI